MYFGSRAATALQRRRVRGVAGDRFSVKLFLASHLTNRYEMVFERIAF